VLEDIHKKGSSKVLILSKSVPLLGVCYKVFNFSEEWVQVLLKVTFFGFLSGFVFVIKPVIYLHCRSHRSVALFGNLLHIEGRSDRAFGDEVGFIRLVLYIFLQNLFQW
jgi:hypothetical protein